MNIATIWIIVGIVLILSELMATSIVAVFFGIAAIIVGLLLNFGLIESYSMQYLLFGVLSLVLLFTARGRCKRWFVGYTADNTEQQTRLADDIGRMTIVASYYHYTANWASVEALDLIVRVETPKRPSLQEMFSNPSSGLAWMNTAASVAKTNSGDPMFAVKGTK